MIPSCNGMMRNIQSYSVSRGYQPYPHPNSINRYPQVSSMGGSQLTDRVIQLRSLIHRTSSKWAPVRIRAWLSRSPWATAPTWAPSGRTRWVSGSMVCPRGNTFNSKNKKKKPAERAKYISIIVRKQENCQDVIWSCNILWPPWWWWQSASLGVLYL